MDYPSAMTRPLHSLVPSSAPPLSAGRLLGDKFEIMGVLGEGGTGIVYDARRITEDDRVALKVVHPHLAGDKQIRGRFTREASILRRLEGKHLCPLIDFGELSDPRRPDSGLLYMVLPKIDGIALDALIAKDRALPIARGIDIVLQTCDALTEAHSQGVIHRDLKPGNVILRGGEHVIVVDFGMAKIMTGGGGTGTTNLTQHNMVFGTPEYMAPEQAKGDELDARCDVYAAGIMLYELLTGRVPFSGATPLNVLTAHLTTMALRPRESAPDRAITPALEAVVMHAIEKDPAKRYATASALGAAVRGAVSAPDDVDAVAPSRRVVSVLVDEIVADEHALTMPAPEPSDSRREVTVRPPAERARSVRPDVVISVPNARTSVIEPHPPPSRLWALVWIIAAVVGISIGVWLSLRGG
jgi:serine/threonine protein kinase